MQARPSASPRHPLALGFWLLATCAVAAACSDDGNLLGSESSAGSGGAQAGSGGAQAGNGGAQSGNGGAQAGAQTSAGAAVVAGAGGSASEGGSSSDGGHAGASSGGDGAGGGGDCVGETCAANETCVAHRTIGGAIPPPDQDNQCMAGRHPEGSYCQADFMYSCATLTGCSTPSATCRCAAGTGCAGTTVCRLPAASVWLDSDAQLVCELLAP